MSSLLVLLILPIQIMCLLQKSLYGLKQAPRAWNKRFATYLRSLGFVASAMDTSLFVYRNGDDIAYLLLYVDDIVLQLLPTHCFNTLLIVCIVSLP
jgi:hypothetical protein